MTKRIWLSAILVALILAAAGLALRLPAVQRSVASAVDTVPDALRSDGPSGRLAHTDEGRREVGASREQRQERRYAWQRKEERAERRRDDNPAAAQRFYLKKRVRADGTLPVENYFAAAPRFRARKHLAGAMPFRAAGAIDTSTAATTPPTWTSLGPGNIGGRVRAIVAIANPTTGGPDILVAGGVSGGVWKSTDGGTSWNPVDDLMANLAVSTLALDPHDTTNQTLFAGTGEGFDFNPNSTDGERSLKRGAGIFKSGDQGVTWTQLASTTGRDFHYVNKIAVSPNSATTIYAATNTGLWIGAGNGTSYTWSEYQAPILGTGDYPVADVAAVNNSGVDYVYFWVVGQGLYLYIADTNPANDGFVNPSAIPSSAMYRGAIAAATSAPDTLYVAVSDNSFKISGLWSTTTFTSFANVLNLDASTPAGRVNAIMFSNPPYAFNTGGGLTCDGLTLADPAAYAQGWYDIAIAVDPTAANRVWVGGIDLFRSENSGVSFNSASTWWANPGDPSMIHADHHVVLFSPGYDGAGNTTMYFGNDGGVWSSTDAYSGITSSDICQNTYAASQYSATPDTTKLPQIFYTDLNNGIGITQFWHGSVAADRELLAGGTQDNGTIVGGPDANTWETLAGGDGGYTAFDSGNTSTFYQEYYYLDMYRLSLQISGGVVTAFLAQPAAISGGITSGGQGLFINPYAMDPGSAKRLYVTNENLWVTDDATASSVAWRNLGPLVSANSNINGSALAVAPSDSRVLYVGTEDGHLYRFDCTAPVLASATDRFPPQPLAPGGRADAQAVAATAGAGWGRAAGLAALLLGALGASLLLVGVPGARPAGAGSRRGARAARLSLLLASLLIVWSCAPASKSTSTSSSSSSSGGTSGLPPGALATCTTYSKSNRSLGLPLGFVSSVTVHPTDPNTVYVTFSTFGVQHLWKSGNGGSTWATLDGSGTSGIPDIPAHTLFIDPADTTQLYLGTDLGVLFSGDSGVNWTSINTNGMANVTVETLAYRAAARALYAFTHGRGVFRLALP